MCMSHRVGSIVTESYLQEEQVPEVFRGPQVSSFMDTNTFLEQGKPRRMLILFLSESLLYHLMLLPILCNYVREFSGVTIRKMKLPGSMKKSSEQIISNYSYALPESQGRDFSKGCRFVTPTFFKNKFLPT
jgi:hypothetical protein